MKLRAVFFDIGETIINEERLWRAWADYLHVPQDDFLAVLEETIKKGESHRKVFEHFRPHFDLAAARRERAAQGNPDIFSRQDLYPDVEACLKSLHDAGYLTGAAGNQPHDAQQALNDLHLDLDIATTSKDLGAEKPSLLFFEKLAARTAFAAHEIAYIGDRVDQDVIPASQAGFKAVFIARGPWGRLHAKRKEAARADARIASLAELPSVLARLGA